MLVLTSGATVYPREMTEEVHGHDIVLEVQQIRRWSSAVGKHVTLVSIDGAVHDVTLSRDPSASRSTSSWNDSWTGTSTDEPRLATLQGMNPVTGLALGRVAIGLVSYLSPSLAGQLFRLDLEANPQLPYLSRMFGSREIALGALTLASSGSTRRNLILAGIAVDGTDAVAGHLAGREGSVGRSTGLFLSVAALGAVGAGVVGILGGKR